MLKSKKNYKLSIRHKEQSQRQLKVAQTIHSYSSLVECFRREGKLDYRLYGVPISIVEVNISPDLKVANCFFVPFNTELSISELLEALEESKYVIRIMLLVR